MRADCVVVQTIRLAQKKYIVISLAKTALRLMLPPFANVWLYHPCQDYASDLRKI